MRSDDDTSLDALHPHDSRIDTAQQAWLRSQVSRGDRVLDLGCGGGRILLPLVQAGAICTGIDHDDSALAKCRESLDASSATATLVKADMIEWLSRSHEHWNVVCCLGNTLCQFWEIDRAVELLRCIRSRLVSGGILVVDDVPGDLWPELAEGNWQSGFDDELGRQLVWSSDDAVFAIRSGSNIDENNWEIGPADTPMRLWTSASLRLAAQVAGYSAPFVPDNASVRVLRPS